MRTPHPLWGRGTRLVSKQAPYDDRKPQHHLHCQQLVLRPDEQASCNEAAGRAEPRCLGQLPRIATSVGLGRRRRRRLGEVATGDSGPTTRQREHHRRHAARRALARQSDRCEVEPPPPDASDSRCSARPARSTDAALVIRAGCRLPLRPIRRGAHRLLLRRRLQRVRGL